MLRMIGWSVIGEIVGFVVLFGLFMLAARRHPGPEFGVLIVFSIVGSIPVAAIAALFAAVSVIQNEIRNLSRQVRAIDAREEAVTGSSSHFTSSPRSTRD